MPAGKKAKSRTNANSARKKTQKKTTTAKPRKNFAEVFTALRELLAPYEDRLAFKTSSSGYVYLESRTPIYKNRPMFFAAVRTGKNYVSYHLMPVYACPDLGKEVSPALKKRMQGKACFNFAAVDPELFAELARLTETGYHKFRSMKYLE